MTNTRRTLLAIALALAAALGYYLWWSNTRVSVPVAMAYIKAETPITKGLLALKPFPREAVSSGWLLDISQIVGKVARVDIFPGEPFDERRLAEPGELSQSRSRAGITLPPGKVAFAVPTSVAGAVGGMVRAGDRVDIIGVPPGANPDQSEARLLLSNVPVIDVRTGAGQHTEGDPPINIIVLEVTPEEAKVLAVWTAAGQIQLALTTQEAITQPPEQEATPQLPTMEATPAIPASPTPIRPGRR